MNGTIPIKIFSQNALEINKCLLSGCTRMVIRKYDRSQLYFKMNPEQFELILKIKLKKIHLLE